MKKSTVYATTMLSLSCCFFFLLSFVFKNINQYWITGILLLLIFLTAFLLGFDRSKKRFEKDIILIILISCITYYVIIYLSGLFFGFNYNVYNLSLISIFKNILPATFMIILCEVCRFMINTKIKENRFLLYLSFVFFFLVDTSLVFSKIDFHDLATYIDSISLYIIPSISKNVLLTYLSTKSSYKTQISYRLIQEIPIFLVPIVPNLGNYLQAICELSLPVIVLIIINNFYKKLPMNQEKNKSIKSHKLLYVCTFILLGIVISLTSGLFSHQAIVIASGSMQPHLYRGDVVIVKKLKENEKRDLNIGDILVFKREDKIIVHRIYKKYDSGKEVFFETKGDHNDNPDGYLIEENDIIGTTHIKIKYIGYPTVFLYDLFNE